MSEKLLASGSKWVGARVDRKEDPRLLTGAGRFVDDLHRDRMLHAQFVRSRSALARITSVDLSACLEVPGVVAAYTAEDLGMAPIVAQLDRPESEFTLTKTPVLASERVRFIGDPIAIVVATDPYAAEDGVEAAVVEYDEETPVVDIDTALADEAAQVHTETTRNTYVDVSLFDTDGVDEAFESAHTVVDLEISTGRQNALPLETRGVLAEWDERESQVIINTCSQVPHLVRTVAAASMGIPERSVRVIVPDMGGGFGIKCVVGREEIVAAEVARRMARPVKWIEDRKDAISASFLSREQKYSARAAFAEDGRFLALDADVLCDMGAYQCYPFTAGIEPLMASAEMPGVYKLGAYRVHARGIATCKAPTAPYRGVSRPQYVMLMEMLMDKAAGQLGMDRVEIRRRNVITEFPYTGVNNITYDPGSYLESLNLAEEMIREAGWYDTQREAEAATDTGGKWIGIGYSCFSERTGYGSAAFAQRKMQVIPGFDISTITMDVDGTVVVTTGTMSHGQSHETTMAQIVADALHVDYNDVHVHQDDTNRITYGFGTFASRSAAIGGSAVRLASLNLVDILMDIAAHVLETNLGNLQLGDSEIRLVDDPSVGLTYAEIANIAYLQAHRLPKEVQPGLHATATFDVNNDGTFSNASQAAVVEVDPGTGGVRILDYVCVEDCGVALNPKVVDGQARGGIAQGIAGALFEEITYDHNGEPSAASFMDYQVPTAMEMPDIRMAHLETPCQFTETGAKGAGEGGTIGAPAAVINAVNDALRSTGVRLNRTPITPQDVMFAFSGNET